MYIVNDTTLISVQDYLIAMGLVDGNSLGCDLSGTIRETGANVTDFHVGDRVMAIAENSFSTLVRTLASNCVILPETLSFQDAATMPIVFATTIHALLDLGRLEPGQVSSFTEQYMWYSKG